MKNINKAGGCLLILLLICAVIAALPLSAEIPGVTNYQGWIYDSLAQPITGLVSMDFMIYDDSIGGSLLWSESHSDVEVEAGHFSVDLGSVDSLDNAVFENEACWLEIHVEGETILPRTLMMSSPYAARIGTINGASGGNIQGDLSSTDKASIGPGNINTGEYGFVAGANNTVGESFAAMGNRTPCEGTGNYANTGGGDNNVACGEYSVIGGGKDNVAQGNYSVISGGSGNYATNLYSTVGGGQDNDASANWATIIGGYNNFLDGRHSTIAGGYNNTIAGGVEYSYLFGIDGYLEQDSTFMVDLPHIRFGNELSGYEFPASDGSAGQTLITDGNGLLGWTGMTGSQEWGWQDEGTEVRLNNLSDDVGIGTNNPLSQLHVRETSMSLTPSMVGGTNLVIEDDDAVLGLYSKDIGLYSGAITMGQMVGSNDLDNKWSISRSTSNQLRFNFGTSNLIASNSRFMIIDESGNVGIGTDSPDEKLHVSRLFYSTQGLYFPDASVQTTAANGGAWDLIGDVLATHDMYGITRGGANNVLYNNVKRSTNFGVASTTGLSGATTNYGDIYGGRGNVVEGDYCTILNGLNNEIQGDHNEYCIILGGKNVVIQPESDYTVAFGEDMTVPSGKKFILYSADKPGRLWINRDENSSGHAGVFQVGSSGSGHSDGNGAHVTKTGIWTNGSKYAGRVEAPVNEEDILNQIADLPIGRSRIDDLNISHIGPCGEDLASILSLGLPEKSSSQENMYIAPYDMAGIALAAIKELYRKSLEIEMLEAKVEELENRLEKYINGYAKKEGQHD